MNDMGRTVRELQKAAKDGSTQCCWLRDYVALEDTRWESFELLVESLCSTGAYKKTKTGNSV